MSMDIERQKWDTRIREAPEVVGLNPDTQTSRYAVAAIAVLTDLLLSTIRPDHFDELLNGLEEDEREGDANAAAEIRWLRLWTDGTVSVASTASDGYIDELIRPGQNLIITLLDGAMHSNGVTGEPRLAELVRTLKYLARFNRLALGCLTSLDVAFVAMQRALGHPSPVPLSEMQLGP